MLQKFMEIGAAKIFHQWAMCHEFSSSSITLCMQEMV